MFSHGRHAISFAVVVPMRTGLTKATPWVSEPVLSLDPYSKSRITRVNPTISVPPYLRALTELFSAI